LICCCNLAYPLVCALILVIVFLLLDIDCRDVFWVQLRIVERKLSSARRWAEEVAKCSISVNEGRLPKVSFGVVERLVGADPVPCIEPHLSSLKVKQAVYFLFSCFGNFSSNSF